MTNQHPIQPSIDWMTGPSADPGFDSQGITVITTNQHPIQTKTIMNYPDLRAICAELLLFSEEAGEICCNERLWPDCDPDCTLQDRARALLAQTESKGPSLKEQGLEAIDNIERYGLPYIEESIKTLRTALEALPNDN